MLHMKHIIWDWNGTLLDDLDVSMDALNSILTKEQLPLVRVDQNRLKSLQLNIIKKLVSTLPKHHFPSWHNNIWHIISLILYNVPCILG